MSTTLIPTLSFRWLEKLDPETMEPEQVLQQRFTTPAGTDVWQDIPMVRESEVTP